MTYINQIQIPEGQRGTYAIEHFTHPANEKLDTSTARTWLIGGQKNSPVIYDHPTTWHRLVYGGGVWMTDLPIEQQQHRNTLQGMKGDVLVGGLGLGLAVNWLAAREEVKSVTVVEISKEVTDLVAPHLRDPRGIVRIVHADLLKYLKAERGKRRLDWAFYDIWQSDGETTFFNVVCPLRKLSEPFVDDSHVICWNEDVMRGQLSMGLHTRYATFMARFENGPTLEQLAHPKTKSIWTEWSKPFFQAVERGVVNDENLQLMIADYVHGYGRPNFRKAWSKRVGR